MINQYSPTEIIKNIWFVLYTKLFYPSARLIRRPFNIRGGKRRLKYGNGLTIGYYCRFDLAGEGVSLTIGSNCKINDRVHISAHERVVVGDNVLMASNIFISDNSHGSYGAEGESPLVPPDDRKVVTEPVIIGNNVWIGEGVSILPGVKVGDGCIIGSNAVVTSNLPRNSIAAGVPAKVIKKWDENSSKWVRV